jgi:[citrate (pro-3S)-lyase] ligase
LHRGGNYIISNATFPSYFINNYKEVSSIHLLLDVKIFGHYIVPVLGINRRYAGGEPFSNITKKYNEVMNKNLIKYGVHFIEVPRVEINNQIVSASEVRKLIKEDKMDEVKKLVPYTTYKFLVSDRAKNIIQNIKIGNKNNL